MSQTSQRERVVALIPCYNARKYIREAVMSFIHQTHKPDLIVVLDDRSGDGFEQEITDLVEERDDVIIHINPENRGLPGCRNEGILNYPADYYVFLDADDICLPDRVEKQVKFLQDNPDCGVVGSYPYFMNAKGKFIKVGTHFYCLTKEDAERSRRGTDVLGLLAGSATMRGTLAHRDGLIFKAGMPACEDIEFWGRVLEANWDVLCIPEPLFGYRIHDESTCSAQTHLVSEYVLYVGDGIRRRRTGLESISFEEYKQILSQRPWWIRFHAHYINTCYALYRNGGACVMNGRYIKGAWMMGLSMIIQPSRLFKAVYHLKQFFNRFKKN